MSYKGKYKKKKHVSQGNNYNPDSLEFFWTKEPHRYTQKQRQIVQERLTVKYAELYQKCYNECVNRLGFDINNDFYIETPFNVHRIIKHDPIIQDMVIPLSTDTVNKIISAPKYFLFKTKYLHNKKETVYHSTIHYYCAMVNNKAVIVTMTTRVGSLDDNNMHSLNSISTHVLLKGKVPFLLSRFDTNPSNHHPNKLENGEIPFNKVHVKGPHEHMYDEKLAVVFPFERFVAHYDAYPCPVFKNFSQAVRFIKNKFNIQDKVFDNSENIFTNIPKLQQTIQNNSIISTNNNVKKLHKNQEDDIINMINM